MNEPLTDYLDALSENHMGSWRGNWCTGCGADWPCLERQAIEELRQHRAEGVNHHATACTTCEATESELIALREIAIAQDASIVERDIALHELREQNAKLVAAGKEMLVVIDKQDRSHVGRYFAGVAITNLRLVLASVNPESRTQS